MLLYELRETMDAYLAGSPADIPVRSLADESFNVLVAEDCCAAATMDLHRHELEIINMIYCHVASLAETISFIQ